MKNIDKLLIMLLLAAGLIATLLLCSCSANKYGCGHGHPKETWSRMVRRINSP